MHVIKCWRYSYLVGKDHHRIPLRLQILEKSNVYKYYPTEQRALEDLDYESPRMEALLLSRGGPSPDITLVADIEKIRRL